MGLPITVCFLVLHQVTGITFRPYLLALIDSMGGARRTNRKNAKQKNNRGRAVIKNNYYCADPMVS